MDQLSTGDTSMAADEQASSEPLSLAPPPDSTSALSSVPTSDAPELPVSDASLPQTTAEDSATVPSHEGTQYSVQTESILKRISDNAVNAAATGTPGWEAAREQVMKDMQTSDKFPTPTPPQESTSSQKESIDANSNGTQLTLKTEGDAIQATPGSSGRGRGGGRPRGRGRGGGRGGKRKRADKSDEESEDSEIYTPVVTTTKSGRSVQKPTSFVPPPASPTTSNKRKRPYRRNPESAVCKVCLRGTSPQSNMIVFCDGCNTPYHQYCHHPPIDQAVVNEVDKEWYCKQCERERVVPVPESDVANFISAEGAPHEQRQRYFASLPPGMLVTLLTRATTLKPDLPLFAPDFRARIGSSTSAMPMSTPSVSNGHTHPPPAPQPSAAAPTMHAYPQATSSGAYPPPGVYRTQPLHYPQQYHQEHYGPDVHPPNYPRPGHGLMRTLPPEQEDLQWLVDEEDKYGVFSHMYQVDPHAANAGMGGGGMGRPH